MVRIRALPSGTVGKAMPVPSTPSLNNSREKAMVKRPSADDDGSDWGFAGGSGLASDVEAEQAEFFFPEAGVGPELLHPLWFGFENVEGRNAGRGNGWRMRGRKQKWARAVAEKNRSDRECHRRIHRERRSLLTRCRPECQRAREFRSDRRCRGPGGPGRRRRGRHRPS